MIRVSFLGVLPASTQQPMNYVSVDIGEAEITPLEAVRQLLMVDAHLVQNGGVEIVNMHRFFHDVIAVVVGLSVGDAFLHPTAGQPHGKATAMMIASVIVFG